MVAPSVARYTEDKKVFQSYGNSRIIDPYGTVVAAADENEAMLVCDIDMKKVDEVREALPYSSQKRKDIYKIVHKA